MSDEITVLVVNTEPVERYSRQESRSGTIFWLDPEKRICGVEQHEFNSVSDQPSRRLETSLPNELESDHVRRYLESSYPQEVMWIVCDSCESVEVQGRESLCLNDEGQSAWAELCAVLSKLPNDRLVAWSIDDWMSGWDLDDWLRYGESPLGKLPSGLDDLADLSDDHLTELATAVEDIAHSADVVLFGTSVYDWLIIARRDAHRRRVED